MLSRIKELMHEQRLSQLDLAQATGIKYDRVHLILNREDSMRVQELFKICDALGIDNPRVLAGGGANA